MSTAQGSGGPRGGQTQLQNSTPRTGTTTAAPRQAVLHLRGASRDEGRGEGSERRRIQWAEDVVDNEGMGKKKSKVCCIYHPPKGIDESSDESSSDSDSDSDSGDDGSARPTRRTHGHGHDHDHSHSHKKGKSKRAPSPNAYEKVPKPKGSGTKEKS